MLLIDMMGVNFHETLSELPPFVTTHEQLGRPPSDYLRNLGLEMLEIELYRGLAAQEFPRAIPWTPKVLKTVRARAVISDRNSFLPLT